MLDNTYAPPTGKRHAPPRHRPPEGTRAERDADAGRTRQKEQTNIHFLSLSTAPRRRGRPAANPRTNETRTQKTKKAPGQNKKRTQDATPEGPAGRDTQGAPRRQKTINIFLFFYFSLGEFADAVRKSRTASHRHKTTKLSKAPETLYLWAFSAVSVV